jgi:PAS domain S-box-containing protein
MKERNDLRTDELTRELDALRQRVVEVEKVEAERRRAEKELQKLSSAIEQAADLIMITDKEGILEYVNPAFEALTGFSKNEVIGRKASVVNSHLHPPDFYQNLWQTILDGKVFRNVFVNLKKNGDHYFEEKIISPIRDEQGNITHFISTGRDVTALKEAEAERARFTNQLRTAADVSSQLSAILDIEELLGKMVSLLRSRFDLYHVHVYMLNKTGNDLFMRVGSGEIGQELRERRHHISLQEEHSLVARAARYREVVLAGEVQLEPDFLANPLLPETKSEVAIPLIAADQVIGVLDLQDDQPHRFSQSDLDTFSALAGHIATTLHNARLFEEQKQAEEALRKSEERFRTVADFTYDWEYWIGPDGNYLYVSPSCERITGYTANDFMEQADLLERITHPADRHLLVNHPDHKLEHQGVTSIDFRIITREGEERWLNHVCHPVYGSDGGWLGRRASNRDITHRKHAEEELRRANQDLDAFARTAAHDLQNPLSLILNYAELLKEEVRLSEEHSQYLSALIRNAHKMNSIINELLLLAGVRKSTVEIKPLNMGRIVSEAQQRLIHMIREYQAELILPANWPEAIGYAPWIEQVWANYISNGIKYGGNPPRLQLGATERSDGLIRFWIRDNGSGLSLEEQARLFVPFTRLDQVRATGHGLGLSIVRRIVTKLGGEVGVESEGIPGNGCIFFFTLPGRRKQ